MKRRSFLQYVIGAVTALFVGTSKAKPHNEIRFEDWDVSGNAIRLKHAKPTEGRYKVYSCFFKGYRIAAAHNRIEWIGCSDIEIPEAGIPHDGFVLGGHFDLFTFDFCKGLFLSNYTLDSWHQCVIWQGEREIWHIVYVGGEQVFQFAYIGTK